MNFFWFINIEKFVYSCLAILDMDYPVRRGAWNGIEISKFGKKWNRE